MGWFERQADGGLSRWYVRPVKEFFAALLEVSDAVVHQVK